MQFGSRCKATARSMGSRKSCLSAMIENAVKIALTMLRQFGVLTRSWPTARF
jgi:hypothetical protein